MYLSKEIINFIKILFFLFKKIRIVYCNRLNNSNADVMAKSAHVEPFAFLLYLQL